MPRGKASAAPGGGLNKVKNGGIARKKGNMTSAPKNLAPVLNDPTRGSNPPAKNDDDKMDIDVEEVDPGDTPDLPDVDGEPPAWAEGRTALGDALPWFRKFQGGMYTRDGICYGVLLSADSGVRSYVDDEIIITRVGGGSERNAEGQLNQVADQKDDNCIVRSLRNSMNFKIAVGAIIGKSPCPRTRNSSR
ncbi:uncharacterized protein BJX67DRAFT_377627 [Aspergillus lucknowensis]|uniref:PA14 domain-containing protein n=1 Tax=Aspergillus lucknowensis TaxID=176173 RepID=A0ABR4M356_9EURO